MHENESGMFDTSDTWRWQYDCASAQKVAPQGNIPAGGAQPPRFDTSTPWAFASQGLP
jgi:hypothetical protein